MDHMRIYEDFICSRREREPALIASGACYARHHILPEALGGDNSPENLIKLVIGEHLFVHGLLARIYGGTMWVALRLMLAKDAVRSNKIQRRKYAYAKKHDAERISGQNNPSADKKVHTLKNHDGRSITGYRTHIVANTEITTSELSPVLSGKRLSTHGWYYPKLHSTVGEGCLPGRRALSSEWVHPRLDKKVYDFYHISGEVLSGTQRALISQGVTGTQSSLLVRGRIKRTRDGWAMHREDCAHAQRGLAHYGADQTIYIFVNTETGEVKECARITMVEFLTTTSTNIGKLVRGECTIKKWTLMRYLGVQKARLPRGKKITIKKEDETFTGTCTECADFIDREIDNVYKLVAGKTKKCNGWTLVSK